MLDIDGHYGNSILIMEGASLGNEPLWRFYSLEYGVGRGIFG
jgi:hypothetical protein